MLKKILSISGRPGIYRLLSQGKNCLIVESFSDGKKIPVFNHERIMSLGDIAIYTTTAEKPLGEVFEEIMNKFDGKQIDIKELEANNSLRAVFGEVLPDYDEERVRTSDIKKVFSWYNSLISNGFDKFIEEPDNEKAETED